MSVTFQCKTTNNQSNIDKVNVTIDEESIQKFKESLQGDFYLPGEKGYDDGTLIWNEMFMPSSDSKYARKPAAVVLPAGTADCVKIMQFAAQHDLLLSIRAGGHNVAGSALCHGGLCINMRRMNATIVDVANRRAVTQGGTLWREFYDECYAARLGTTGGVVSDTGVAGLTVGGGIGYLRTKHGMTVDNVLAMQVVTADGVIRTVDRENHSDLFYALRGGGGGYALVTSFTLQLYPIPDEHWTVLWTFAMDRLPTVVETMQAFIDSGENEEMALIVVAWPNCGIPHPDLQGKDICCIAGGYAGCEGKDAQEVYAQVKDFFWKRIYEKEEEEKKNNEEEDKNKEPADGMDLSHPAPFNEWNRGFDFFFPMGKDHCYWKGSYAPRLTAELAHDIKKVIDERPAQADKSLVAFWTTYGKMLRPDHGDEMAFGKRHPGAFVSFDTTWSTGSLADEACIAYTRKGAAAIEKHADGAYLQWSGMEDERKVASTQQYDQNLDKLVAIKKKYDPNFLLPSWIKTD